MDAPSKEVEKLRRQNERLEAALADRARMLDALQHILDHGAASVGESFFAATARDLAEVLRADCVLIGDLSKDHTAVRTLALWCDGALRPNITYALKDTPCAHVVGKRPCVFEEEIQHLFPNDPILIDLAMEGYVGVPVYGTAGDPLGILVALFRRPIPDGTFCQAMLGLFAARTGAEMERQRQEARRRELSEQLLQTQKLESLGVLAGGIAHDFNNLLASILGSADLALLELAPGHPAIEPIETVIRTSQNAGALCRQLLAYAGKGHFRVTRVDLVRLIEDMQAILRASAPRRVEISYDLQPDLPPVVADESQIGQIVLNLVTNAAEAIGEDTGTVTIRLYSRHVSPEDVSSCTTVASTVQPGPFVVLEVTDDGCGMSEATLGRIFDPFYTTKFTGRGLGLAALQGIVTGHDGAICVDSRLGDGTTFSVLLPAAEGAAAPRHAPPPAKWRGHGLALIVDDEPMVRHVATRLLARLGFEPIAASDGIEALELARRHGSRVTVALVDLMMPRMGGIETFHALRELLPTLPVVLMSGYNQQTLVQTHLHEGLAGFVQKPFRADDLSDALREAMDPRSQAP